MALLDQLLSGLTGVSGSPLRGVLMNVLGQGGSQNGGAGGVKTAAQSRRSWRGC
jgi:hypothetical protein